MEFSSKLSKYLTFVLFDRPENNISGSNENTGGNTAAPTFSKIVKKVSPIISKSNYLKKIKNMKLKNILNKCISELKSSTKKRFFD